LPRRTGIWSQSVVLEMLFLFLALTLALSTGITATAHLFWPYDVDLFRDIASARTIADGHWHADPYYAGEYLWYNPLVPSLVAVLSWISNLDVPLVYTRAGAYLNLLPALAFYALVRAWFGAVPAAAALTTFLFVAPRGAQPWVTATYTPWLFASSFSQAFFYLSVLCWLSVRRKATTIGRLTLALTLGLALLSHAAPALLFVLVLVVDQARRIHRAHRQESRASVRALVWEFALIVGIAAVISLPLTWWIAGHYHLQVQNPLPAQWQYDLLTLEHVRGFLMSHATPATALAIVGAIALWRRPAHQESLTVLWIWTFLSIALVGRGYLVQLAPWTSSFLPSPVPDYHYLLYLRALINIFAGYGFIIIIKQLVDLTRRLTSGRRRVESAESLDRQDDSRGSDFDPSSIWTLRLGYLLLAIAVAATAPRLAKRADFSSAVREANAFSTKTSYSAIYQWIRTSVGSEAVFLASNEIGQFVIGPAGGKLVAVDPYFSNPYVDYLSRGRDRQLLFERLARSDRNEFCSLANRYRVRFVVSDPTVPLPLHGISIVEPVFHHEELRIWAVRGCSY